MGALPDRLPGFQHVENDEVRAKFDRAWGVRVPPQKGLHLTGMFEAMEHGTLKALYVIGENPAQSEADQHRSVALLRSLDVLVVQDVMHTATVDLADVALPAAAGAFESDGTFTSSERRVQRVRRAKTPPGESREDLAIIFDMARHMGVEWGAPDAERVWDELRTVSPVHAGMSYARLAAEGGLQWPCYDESHPGETFLHGRLWERPVGGPRAPFSVVAHELPVEALDDDYPLRLTTGRRLAEYNTGVQTGGYASPVRRGETIDVSPEDAARLGLREGQAVRVRSRRGAVVAPVHIDHAPSARAHVHDAAFSGRGSDQSPHHRRLRSEIRHGGVQGRRDSSRSRGRRGRIARWIFTSSAPRPLPRNARRWTGCSDRQRAAGTAACAMRRATAAPRAAAGPPRLRCGTCCCLRSMRCRTASVG